MAEPVLNLEFKGNENDTEVRSGGQPEIHADSIPVSKGSKVKAKNATYVELLTSFFENSQPFRAKLGQRSSFRASIGHRPPIKDQRSCARRCSNPSPYFYLPCLVKPISGNPKIKGQQIHEVRLTGRRSKVMNTV